MHKKGEIIMAVKLRLTIELLQLIPATLVMAVASNKLVILTLKKALNTQLLMKQKL